jgi:predicted molibdopterin-dependent oxidoreductase YjgC
LVLSTGRRLYHYHTRAQIGRCQGLNNLLAGEKADISISDSRDLGISDDDRVKVVSLRGEVEVTTRVTAAVQQGMVWMASGRDFFRPDAMNGRGSISEDFDFNWFQLGGKPISSAKVN